MSAAHLLFSVAKFAVHGELLIQDNYLLVQLTVRLVRIPTHDVHGLWPAEIY